MIARRCPKLHFVVVVVVVVDLVVVGVAVGVVVIVDAWGVASAIVVGALVAATRR